MPNCACTIRASARFARIARSWTTLSAGSISMLPICTQPLNPSMDQALLPEEELRVTAQTVARAAEAGIPLARAISTSAAEAMGVGLVNILRIVSHEIIILGGGVMQMGNMLMEPALKVVQERAMRANLAEARIVQAQLGMNVGLIGAGALPQHYQK